MKAEKFVSLFVGCILVAATVHSANGGGSDIPFSAIRLRKPQTDSPAVWKATLEQFRKHRAGVDDVWFSTGICFPDMAQHRSSATGRPAGPAIPDGAATATIASAYSPRRRGVAGAVSSFWPT